MNPSSNEGLQLPAPVSNEQAPQGGAPAESQSSSEALPAAPEQSLGAAQAAVAAVPDLPLPGQSNAAGSGQDDSAASATDLPSLADDNDLIEKEWVNKAKQIVNRTREDPYQQSEQLTAVKADYMQKRYNKTIKLDK